MVAVLALAVPCALALRAARSLARRNQSSSMASLRALVFDNRNLRELPVDPAPFVPGESRQVPNSIFSRVCLQPVQNPRLIARSNSALALVGLETATDEELSKYLGGNELLPGSEPSAHCYCGHQFGSFAGQLGDGAAMYLGEVATGASRWELQLKGAGTTPYSRSSDGRKVLRSSVREFMCSEAMHHLGIPTTRAASCVTSDSTVARDPLYDGRTINERCTIVSRVAENFFRFGSFEIFKRGKDRDGPSAGNEVLKKKLVDHVIATYFPHLVVEESPAAAFLRDNVRRTARLVAQWQAFGFTHGVLNTDNMSVISVTIDYGPFGFVEAFDPDFTPNGSDGGGRYSYSAQPSMCKWNLSKLADALVPIVPSADGAAIVQEFDDLFSEAYSELLAKKLGLSRGSSADALAKDLFSTMAVAHTDFTDSFRALTAFRESLAEGGRRSTDVIESLKTTLLDALVSRSSTPEELSGAMKRKLRIHRLGMSPENIEGFWTLLQGADARAKVAEMFGQDADFEALRQEVGTEKKKLDMLVFASQEMRRLEMVSPAVQARKSREAWAPWVEAYVGHVLQHEPHESEPAQLHGMQNSNPTFILRNWVAETAIRAAELGDFTKVRIVSAMLERPFDPAFCSMRPAFRAAACRELIGPADRQVTEQEREFIVSPPAWAASLLCTCSS